MEVWKTRSVFDRRVQDVLDQRLKEIDQQRAGKGTGGRLGGSLFGSSTPATVPAELEGVAKSQAALSKSEAAAQPALETAKTEYDEIEGLDTTDSSQAPKLGELVKTLEIARGALEESIKMREELLSGLEKLVESNRAKLLDEQSMLNETSSQQADAEAKHKEAEEAIVQQMQNSASQNGTGLSASEAISAPEFEGFTPPAPEVESFTPPAQDLTTTGDVAPLIGENGIGEQGLASTTGAEDVSEIPPNFNEPPPSFEPPAALQTQDSAAAAANDFLENLNNSGMIRPAPNDILTDEGANGHSGDPRLKRRKMSHRHEADVDSDIFGSAAAGLDEDAVTAMLGDGGEAAGEADVGGYGW